MWYDDILKKVSSPETLRLRSLSVRVITQGMYDDGARLAIRARTTGEDHVVDALLQQDAQVAVLLLGVLGGRTDERGQPPCEQGGLNGVGELGEEGVAHVGHEEGDDVGVRGPQRAGPGVDGVAEPGGGGRDPRSKSMKHTTLPGRMKMLPGCGSA